MKQAQKEPAFNNLVSALSQFMNAPIPQPEKKEMFGLALIVAGMDSLEYSKEMSKYR